ncbi:hypothetical protein TPHA_0P01450 [Tetrapisispora phaffii CBS 4417]|uniref:Myb/SANT-like DNA-binding domain-containing protein n=1 Tax=Tetrapisispora phaffii (strain ATCC 24235 / CBS 4417 / NBRC 1672 / NRRL Y-8282 / UCD 70-5) TaxID=1071381 RepID=G8C2C5_TETPH|nr:hypothetical protein TPHA_0P01450 [Tetrapisispora phaffii CBS 4417]CCE66303.1 hypothetical protein TPHA_0P01450 [Tetrapisispora phaffii CBS 4417]
MTNDSYNLLKLIDEYQPHVKGYPERLQTWELVRKEYNSINNTRYKQSRSLRNKFRNLKEQCRSKDVVNSLPPKALKLLKKLIVEEYQMFDSVFIFPNFADTENNHTSDMEFDANSKQRQIIPSLSKGREQFPKKITNFSVAPFLEVNSETDDVSDVTLYTEPLDSIQIGHPHTYKTFPKLLSHPTIAVTGSEVGMANLPIFKPRGRLTIDNSIMSVDMNTDHTTKNSSDNKKLCIKKVEAVDKTEDSVNSDHLDLVLKDIKAIKESQEDFQKTVLLELSIIRKNIEDVLYK